MQQRGVAGALHDGSIETGNVLPPLKVLSSEIDPAEIRLIR